MQSHVKQILKLIFLSVSFLLVFLSFNGTQTIVSSLLPGELGYWSVGTIYIAFTASSLLLSSAFVIAVSTKWSAFIGGVLYLGFIVANIFPMWDTLIPFAIVLGIGASIIWAAQGAYVTAAAIGFAKLTNKPERSVMGLFNGIFFGIFQLSMVIGNLISSFILGDDSSSYGSDSFSSSAPILSARGKMLFYTYTAICSAGVIGLLFLPRPDVKGVKTDVSAGKRSKSTVEKIIGAIYLWKEPRMFLMIPYLVFTGLEQAFIFGDFTKQYLKAQFGLGKVGFVMSAFGAIDSIGSFLIGRITDRVGVRWIGYSGAFLLTIFLSTLRFFSDHGFGTHIAAGFMWAALLGLSDACIFSVFCNAAMATLFPDRAEAAFSNVKVFQAGATGLMFFLGPHLDFYPKIYIIGGSMIVALICIIILDVFVYPLRPQKKEDVSGQIQNSDSSADIQESAADSEKTPLVKVDSYAGSEN